MFLINRGRLVVCMYVCPRALSSLEQLLVQGGLQSSMHHQECWRCNLDLLQVALLLVPLLGNWIHCTVPLVVISPSQATNPLELVKTKGNRAAEDYSNSVGNQNSNLLRADKALPSLCVPMGAAGAQESSTSGMLIMRIFFNWPSLHGSTFLPHHLHHPLTKHVLEQQQIYSSQWEKDFWLPSVLLWCRKFSGFCSTLRECAAMQFDANDWAKNEHN